MENDLLDYKAKYILEYSVEKAVSALATIVHSDAAASMVELTGYTQWLDQFQLEQAGSEGHTIMLKTEIVGPFSGINYCLFSKDEMTRLGEACLPGDLKDPGSGTLLIEFLKEMENILAAATITEIADKLKVSLFGDVPKIEAVSNHEAVTAISQEVVNILPQLVCRSQLNVPQLKFSCDFLWFFDDEFMNKVDGINESEWMAKETVQP